MTKIKELVHNWPVLLGALLVFALGAVIIAGIDLDGQQAPVVVITGNAVTPSLISTPDAADQATAERVTIEAIQTQAEMQAQGDGWDTVAEATAERILLEGIATSQSQKTEQATLAGTPAPTTEWHSFSDKPPAWQVVEVAIIIRYVYDPERDVWIALEDAPQWQAWRLHQPK